MALEVSIKKKVKGFTLNVDFKNQKDCLGILGASGSGKSMILKCIAGIETPDSGRIVLNGRTLFDSDNKINLPAQKRKVGYLFQNYALFPTMTVEENIAVGMKGNKKEKKHRVLQKIQELRLEGLEKHYPHELSGGQQQRVALGRMLAAEPELILLDEPFSALDSYLKEVMLYQLTDYLKDFKGDTVFVSHSRDEVYHLCPKLMVVDQGRIVVAGNTIDIFQSPRYVEVARLTGCKNISRVERLDEYRMFATDWEIELCMKKGLPQTIDYVGIRAHDFESRWELPESNFIPFDCTFLHLPEEKLLLLEEYKEEY